MKFLGLFQKPVLGLKESGIGLVSRGNSIYGNKIDEAPQNISLQQKYLNAYNNFPMISGAIDMTAEQAVQDFYFEGPNSEKLTKWAEQVNLPQKLLTIAKHMLINGNIWAEVPDTKELKLIDPRTMTTWRRVTGDVIGHSQQIEFSDRVIWGSTGDTNKDTNFKKKSNIKNIVHFKYNCLAGDKYGNSIIHPCLPLLETKDQIESDLKIIVRRYAAPIIHVQVGDEMHLPNDTDISDIRSKVQDIYSDTEYVTNFLTKFNVIGFEGKAMKLDTIMKHIDANILRGLKTFESAPGYDDSDKATDEVNLRKLGRHVKSLQRDIKQEFEDNIIIGTGIGNINDHIIFGAAEEREWEINVDILRGLTTDGLITPQKANSLLPPEFREKLPEPLMNPIQTQAKRSQEQNQKPFQKGSDKIKDNPTNPTLKQKEPNQRRNKTDREIPIEVEQYDE